MARALRIGVDTRRLAPAVGPEIIRRRSSLYEKLQAGLGYRLIIVHAGPGCGKTSFLGSFAREAPEINIDLAWLTIDRVHHDRAQLLEYLVRALQTFEPRIGKATLRALSKSRDALRRWDYLLELFCQETRELLDRRALLILDQYESLSDSPGAASTIEYLLGSVSPNLTLLLSSRQPPALASLPRVRTAGGAWEISASDLSFTTDEAREFFFRHLGISPDEKTIETLMARTGGWPAGVRLAGEFVRTRGEDSLTLFSGLLPEVQDYFNEEVLSRESPDTRRFLMSTALVDSVSYGLAQALIQNEDMLAAWARLERGDYFASAVGTGTERSYQYNPVFRSFLLRKLRETYSPEQTRDLHLKLAHFYVRERRWDVAIHHLVEAKEYQKAADLVASLAEGAIEANNIETLGRWIGAFPDEESGQRPWLLLYRGVVDRVNRNWEAALAHYSQAADLFRTQGERGGLARALWYTSQVLADRHHQALAIKIADEALSYLDKSNIPSRAWILHIIGKCCFDLGRTDEALDHYQKAADLFALLGDVKAEMVQHQAKALALHMLGRLGEAQQHYLKTLGLQAYTGDIDTLCWTQAGLAHLRAMRGDNTDSLATLEEALQIARTHQLRSAEMFILSQMTDVLIDNGDYSEAEKVCEQALIICESIDEVAPQIEIKLKTMELDLLRGRPGLVRKQSLGVEAVIVATNLRTYEITLDLLMARVLIEEQRYDEAKQGVIEARNRARMIGAKYHEAQASFLLARILLLKGETYASAKIITELLPIIEDERFIGFLLRNHGITRELLINGINCGSDLERIKPLLEQLERIKREPDDQQAIIQDNNGLKIPGSDQLEPTAPRQVFLEAFFLGAIRVRLEGSQITDRAWRTSKAKELFAYLLLHSDGSATRDELLEVLWPELSLDSAVSNFHFTLHSLRHALEPHLSAGSRSKFLVLDGRRYHLQLPSESWIDVREFRTLVREGLRFRRSRQSEYARSRLQRAVELYQGDYLTDLYADWAEQDRATLLESYLKALRELAWLAYDSGDYEQVVFNANAMLSRDCYLEDGHRLLMRAACETGNPAQALRQYDQFCSMLKQELGARPEAASQQLYRWIKEGTYQRASSHQLSTPTSSTTR